MAKEHPKLPKRAKEHPKESPAQKHYFLDAKIVTDRLLWGIHFDP